MKTVKRAFITSLPVAVGYIILGIGYGILVADNGFGPIVAFLSGICIYGGTLQFVGVSLMASHASMITTFITSLAVNARHLFYSISMIEAYKDAGTYKPYLAYSLTDETYSLLCDRHFLKEEKPYLFATLVSLFNQCYWVTGSVLGALLGQIIPFSTVGIDFSMTALFIATCVSQWKHTNDHYPAMMGLVSTLLCLIIFGKDTFLIPSMVLITLGVTVLKKVRGR